MWKATACVGLLAASMGVSTQHAAGSKPKIIAHLQVADIASAWSWVEPKKCIRGSQVAKGLFFCAAL